MATVPTHSRSLDEIKGVRRDFTPELVAAAERAMLLDDHEAKLNVALAVRRLGMARGHEETYNEGLNLLATVLCFMTKIRPPRYLMVQRDGLAELEDA